jgi:hypothetical protein
LTGKPVRKGTLGRPSNRWEDDIKTSTKGTGSEAVDWINVAQDRDKWQALAA